MALASAVKGSNHRPQTISWDPALDLTSATLAGTIRDANGKERAIDGNLAAVEPPTGGSFTWEYGTNDIAQAGDFQVKFSADYGSGDKEYSYWMDWKVNP